MTITLDGVSQNSNDVLLLNDQIVHDVKISLPVLSVKRKRKAQSSFKLKA